MFDGCLGECCVGLFVAVVIVFRFCWNGCLFVVAFVVASVFVVFFRAGVLLYSVMRVVCLLFVFLVDVVSLFVCCLFAVLFVCLLFSKV